MTAPFNPFGNITDDDDSNEDISFGTEENNTTSQPEEKTFSNTKEPTESFKPEKKHNIVDQYWLINPKLFAKEKLEQGEVQLLTLGYNADFSNMRIALFETNNETFAETAIHKYNAKQIVTANIFTETAEQVIFNVAQAKSGVIYNFERLFSSAMVKSEWKPAKSIFEVDASKGTITIKVNDSHFYVFKDWQLKALLNTFKFMTNGNSWMTSLYK
jgi:hypothetical protein